MKLSENNPFGVKSNSLKGWKQLDVLSNDNKNIQKVQKVQPNSRLPPQLINRSNHKNVSNLVFLTDFMIKSGVAVAETHP